MSLTLWIEPNVLKWMVLAGVLVIGTGLVLLVNRKTPLFPRRSAVE